MAAQAMSSLEINGHDAVSVYDEPYHRVELEHPLVRVVRFKFQPGERTQYHRHFVDSVFCFFESTRLRVEANDTVKEVDIERFSVAASPYAAEPICHRLENIGAKEMHGLDIEIIAPTDPRCLYCGAFELGVPWLRDEPHFTFVKDVLPWCCAYPHRVKNAEGKYVRERVTHGAVHCYTFRLAAGEATGTWGCDQPRLFVWFTSGELVTRSSDHACEHRRRVTAGSYAFDDHRFHGKFENAGDTAIEAVVVVWSAISAALSPVKVGFQLE